MRNHLIAALEKIAEKDSRIVVFTADLGYHVLDAFAEKFPSRCFNVGICEQNMTAMAAGMALEGYEVYTYSIGNFPVMRCLEQIRNCVCYHNANVKIIAVGGGFVYGQLGMSHHATEDVAVMRALPNMRIFCPSGPEEAIEVLHAVHAVKGPAYLRLARGGEEDLCLSAQPKDVVRICGIKTGESVAVLATGPVLAEALDAYNILEREGIRIGVYNCIALKPFDVDGLMAIARRYKAIVTVEEHNVVGGLGSIVSDALMGIGCHGDMQIVKLGLQDVYTSVVGSQKYLRQYYHIDAKAIVEVITELMG